MRNNCYLSLKAQHFKKQLDNDFDNARINLKRTVINIQSYSVNVGFV